MKKDKYPIVTKYCEENPDMMTRTLARLIYSQHPAMFKDLEHVRGIIRQRRGNKGKRSKATSFKHLHSEAEQRSKSYYLKPEVDPEIEVDFPRGLKSTLLISDIHLPYHDERALFTALGAGKKRGVDSIVINGDLLDFYQVSSFSRNPTRKSIKYELDMAAEFFDLLREMFPDQVIWYKLGNHEKRYENYLKAKCRELFADEYYKIEERLSLGQWGIKYVEDFQKINYGKLNIIHGHETGRSVFNPVNPARGLFLRTKCSTICGHNHQTSEHHENNLNGDSIACWSTGALCHLTPEYNPFGYTKWNWGYALLEKDKKGSFEVDNKRILS